MKHDRLDFTGCMGFLLRIILLQNHNSGILLINLHLFQEVVGLTELLGNP